MSESEAVEVGDAVTIGGSKAVHWDVICVYEGTYNGSAMTKIAILKSGMTERERREPVSKLKIYKKGAASA